MEKNKNRVHNLILELSHIFSLKSSLDASLNVAMLKLNDVFKTERSSIFLVDPMKEQLTSFSSLDLEKREIQMPTSLGIAGWVFENRQPVIVNQVTDDSRFYNRVDQVTGFTTRNLICAPLIDPKKCCLGTLQSLNKNDGEFEGEDLELLVLTAHLLSIAIDNSRLYRELKLSSDAKGKVLEKLTKNPPLG